MHCCLHQIQQPNVTQSMTPHASPMEGSPSLSSPRAGGKETLAKVLGDAARGVTPPLMRGRGERNPQGRGGKDTSSRPGQTCDDAGDVCGERCEERQVESDPDEKWGAWYEQFAKGDLEGHRGDLYPLATQKTVDVEEKCHVGDGGSNTPRTRAATPIAETAAGKGNLTASMKKEGGEPQLGSTLATHGNRSLPMQQHLMMGIGVSNINTFGVPGSMSSGNILRPQPQPSFQHSSACTRPRCIEKGEAKSDTPGPSAENFRAQQNEKIEIVQAAPQRRGTTEEEVEADESNDSYSTDSCSAGGGPPNVRDSAPICQYTGGGFSTRNEDATNALHGGRREEESIQQIHGGVAEQKHTSRRCGTNHAGDEKRAGEDSSAAGELRWKLVLSLPPSSEPEPEAESLPLDPEDAPVPRQPELMCGPDSGGGRPPISDGQPRLGDVGLEDGGHNAVQTITQVRHYHKYGRQVV